jgi:hypothetical protein
MSPSGGSFVENPEVIFEGIHTKKTNKKQQGDQFMKKNRLIAMVMAAGICAVGLMAGTTASAIVVVPPATTIQVFTALAPNGFGSPSYNTWVNNATFAIANGLSSFGDPSSPSFYQIVSSAISVDDAIVTGFPSWQGVANPGSVFGAAYANELGNRPSFGLLVNGNGSLISISQLSFTASSSDSGNVLGFNFSTGSYGYSSSYEGILWGPGGQSDIANYTYITSGSANQEVNEIVGRGSGNALDAYETDPGANDQERIDNAAAGYGDEPFTFTGTYSLGSAQGSGSFEIEPVPEPGTIALAGLGGLATLVFFRKGKKA